MSGLIKYEAQSGGEVQLSPQIIKKYFCEKATDQEIEMFLQLCHYQRLNPFLREAYLIKYGNHPATIVTGKETFTKRAETHKEYDGFKAGIIVLDSDTEIVYREGSFKLSEEKLVGGWAEVYRKDIKIPVRVEVSLDEYIQLKQDTDGKNVPNKMWGSKPGTMIRKVALVQALREAFPNLFGGLYDSTEMPVDVDKLPDDTIIMPEETEPEPPKYDAAAIETILSQINDRKDKCKAIPELENVWKKYVAPIQIHLNAQQIETLTSAFADKKKELEQDYSDKQMEELGEFPPEDLKEQLAWYKHKITNGIKELQKYDEKKYSDAKYQEWCESCGVPVNVWKATIKDHLDPVNKLSDLFAIIEQELQYCAQKQI